MRVDKVQNSSLVLTVDYMRTYLSVNHTDHDTMIQDLILECQDEIENYCWIAFLETTFKMYLESWPVDNKIPIYHAPLIGVTSIEYYDSNNASQSLTATTSYIASLAGSPAYIKLIDTMPLLYERSDAITVTYTCGYASTSLIPAGLKKCLKALISRYYDHPSAEERKMPLNVEYALWPFRNYRHDV